MSEPPLRVLARGTASVQHYEAAPAQHGQVPQRRISHHHDPNVGPKFMSHEGGETFLERRHGAWIKRIGEIVVVPFTAEYYRHLRDGDLYPADDATAAAIGHLFGLTGDALGEALDHNAIPHGWRELALAAQQAKTSLWEQVKLARDEEHGEQAVAAHAAAVAELRAQPGEKPAFPKGVVV